MLQEAEVTADRPDKNAKPLAVVEIDRRGRIAIVTLDNPPVNALGARLRACLYDALAALADDLEVSGIVIACAGSTFVAGADIGEFGTLRQEYPLLPDLCALIEAMQKPVVAAIHGTALGGGLELALACRYRVVHQAARLGLPEVKLGFIPGSGGTVRLPRLVGPERALDMIVSGIPVGAHDAVASGLADGVVVENIVDGAVAFLRTRIEEKAPAAVAVRYRDDKLARTRTDPAGFDALAAKLAAKARGLSAPLACIDAVRNAFLLPFDQALGKEREAFVDLMSGPESRALRHLFFAEREAAKVPGVAKDLAARRIDRVGVIGAGTMGGGIAMAFANAGLEVIIVETGDEALGRGIGMIERNYATSVARGSLSEPERQQRMARLTGATDYAALGQCDLVIEAVFEDIGVKKDVFSRLSQVMRPGAMLATNTSYLDVNEIASAFARPQDVVGLHFFSPANVMKLLEIVRGDNTAADVVATAVSLARKIGKVPVVVGVCHGFVGNRMLAARSAQNEALLLAGATPAQVDKAFIDFGWPMGPFQMADLAGLDIGWRNRKATGKTAAIADTLCEKGHFGQKTGRGYYRYGDGSRMPIADADVEQLIRAKSGELGLQRREISPGEIIARTLYPMINEGIRTLDERIATRASDIDLVWVHGYGFPTAKGGPMHWARATLSRSELAQALEHWHNITQSEIFLPATGFSAFFDN